MKLTRPLGSIALVAMLGSMTACAADVYPPTVGGYETAYAGDVPADVYEYPHVAYEGGNAYLVGDRWYYPTARGWVRLHHESPELARYRAEHRGFVRPAAPAEMQRPAPPGYAYPPPPRER
jgi:hypothetical protein